MNSSTAINISNHNIHHKSMQSNIFSDTNWPSSNFFNGCTIQNSLYVSLHYIQGRTGYQKAQSGERRLKLGKYPPNLFFPYKKRKPHRSSPEFTVWSVRYWLYLFITIAMPICDNSVDKKKKRRPPKIICLLAFYVGTFHLPSVFFILVVPISWILICFSSKQ